jgi:hypothetical protein
LARRRVRLRTWMGVLRCVECCCFHSLFEGIRWAAGGCKNSVIASLAITWR